MLSFLFISYPSFPMVNTPGTSIPGTTLTPLPLLSTAQQAGAADAADVFAAIQEGVAAARATRAAPNPADIIRTEEERARLQKLKAASHAKVDVLGRDTRTLQATLLQVQATLADLQGLGSAANLARSAEFNQASERLRVAVSAFARLFGDAAQLESKGATPMDIETLDTIIMGYHQDADDAAGTEAVHYAGVLEAMVQLANVVAEAEGAAADNPAAMRAFREHRVVRTQEAVLEGLYTAAVRHAIYRGDDVSAYLPQAPAASSAAASAAPQPTGFRRFLPWGHSASIPAASQPSAPVAPVISGEAARRYAAARGWPTTVVAAQELAAQIAAEDAAVAATDQNDPE